LGLFHGYGSFLVISKVFIFFLLLDYFGTSDVDISEFFYVWNFFTFNGDICHVLKQN